jgi:hypothetical protein
MFDIFDDFHQKKLTHTVVFWSLTPLYLVLWASLVREFERHGASVNLVVNFLFTAAMWLYLPIQHSRLSKLPTSPGKETAKVTYVLLVVVVALAGARVWR